MAMNYTTLIAAKSVVGSIKSWVNYSKLDVVTVVDEAQALLYSLLRTREMMAGTQFTMALNESYVALPTGFLDPIGKIKMTSFNTGVAHKDSSFIETNRSYTETSGTLAADPFTVTDGSLSVTVAFTAHGFTQDSVFNTSGSAAAGGVTIDGTFPITSVDTDSFTIDITSLGETPTSTETGGGSAIAYICSNLTAGIPNWYGIWNERMYFDVAFSQVSLCRMQFYKTPPLLSTSNETNFVTSRYSNLLRTACTTSAADFMKDDNEYQKGLTRLTALVQRVSVENDGMMRGMELDPVF